MLSAAPIVFSVLLVMILGKVISLTILKEESFWQSLSRLCYWVLFPAMLFKTIATSDFSDMAVDKTVIALLTGLFGVTVLIWIAGRQFRLNNADLSSLLQGAFRHNGFMALSIIAGLYGPKAVELGTLCLATLVPVSNVMSVAILIYLNKRHEGMDLRRLLLKELIRNPLIISIAAGLAAKYMPADLPIFILDTTELLGRGALPALLLAIGAGVHLSAFRSAWRALLLSALAKAVIFPGLMVGSAMVMGLDGLSLIIIMIVGVMPTAVSSYPLARELGGNAKLMAEILSLQTVLSVPVLLIWLAFIG
ncbi:MAG: AEC family transporter [Candidatus Puniceispirillaceae bacterium]